MVARCYEADDYGDVLLSFMFYNLARSSSSCRWMYCSWQGVDSMPTMCGLIGLTKLPALMILLEVHNAFHKDKAEARRGILQLGDLFFPGE